MLQNLNDFDPIQFLSIKTEGLTQETIDNLRTSLNKSIGRYILLSLSEDIKEEEFERLTSLQDGNEMLFGIRDTIPDMDEKLMESLENFRNEYQGIHKGGNHA